MLQIGGAAAAYCGKLLAELGADVIVIEPPGGDPLRNEPPFFHNEPGPRNSLPFLYLNTSKRSVTLNLDATNGQQLLPELVRRTDILIESLSPDYLSQRGIGYPELSQVNARLVMTSITPFGRTGPYRDYKGAPLVILAMSGMTYLGGWPDRAPVSVDPSVVYYVSSTHAAVGTLIALQHRDSTGKGQRVDVSMTQCLSLAQEGAILEYYYTGKPRTRAGPGISPTVRQCYACKDGYVLCMLSVARWRMFVEALQAEGCAATGAERIEVNTRDDLNRQHEAIEEVVEAFVRDRSKEDIFQLAKAHGLWFSPINTPAEVLRDPQLRARGFFVSQRDEPLGAELSYPGAPYKLSKTPWQMTRLAPWPGQHSDEIYEGELGLTSEELSSLRRAGVI